MDVKPPDGGFSFFVTWGIIEWVLAGFAAVGSGVAGWVWHLGSRIRDLEDKNRELTKLVVENKGEIKQMQQLVRSLEHNLQNKIVEETQRLESRIERMTEKLEQVREELPSRQFIEGQLNNLGQRVDRAIEARSRPLT